MFTLEARNEPMIEFISDVKKDEIRPILRSKNWAMIDIGFATEKASCGYLIPGSKARNITFANLLGDLQKKINPQAPFTLFIEAPLSVSFSDTGNPQSRRWIEDERSEPSPWFINAGSVTFVAAFTLLKRLQEHFSTQKNDCRIRLIELMTNKRETHKFCDMCEVKYMHKILLNGDYLALGRPDESKGKFISTMEFNRIDQPMSRSSSCIPLVIKIDLPKKGGHGCSCSSENCCNCDRVYSRTRGWIDKDKVR